ncbi:MAG TPA: hypothetical protein PK006_06445 [Saprospiraceae bacterium]|nr:hypothetical protein [Saprospiraceae bacterium]
MNIDDHIMIECYTDTLLIEGLVKPRKNGYNHKRNCFEVEKEFRETNNKKGKFKDDFALGIIDKDKKTVAYINEMELLDKIENEIYLFGHKLKKHFIIQLAPALETWLINRCKESNINMSDYNIPNNLKELVGKTKRMAIKKDPNLKSSFHTLNKSKNPTIEQLKKWITVLKNKNRNIIDSDIVNIKVSEN